ncbi:CapA family protein, partial [Rhizobium leguminosarum]
MTNMFTIAVTGQSLIKHDIRGVHTPGFQGVREVLSQADFSFTNFESTILGSHGGWPLKGSFFGCSQPVVLDSLQALGFQALSLSNNHAFDLGPSGILSTLEEVDRRGFLHAGIGRNHTAAARAAKGSFGGRKVALVAMDGGPGPDFMYAADAANGRPERPGVNRLRLTKVIDVDTDTFEQLRTVRDKVGYTTMDLGNDSQPDDAPHVELEAEISIARAIFRRSDRFGRNVKVDEEDLSRNLAAITSAAEEGSLVIAYLHHHHWASDWYQVPEWVGAVAKKCIDAGAAMFVSHGAPVLQPVEIYRGRPIFYSLGNFIFHVKSEKSQWRAREVWESV